jgi:hypothetical protein
MTVTLSPPGAVPANERMAQTEARPDKASKNCLRCMMVSSCSSKTFEWQILFWFETTIATSAGLPRLRLYSN